MNGILPANCRRKVRVLQKRGRARRRKNKQLQSLLRAVPQKHIFRRIPEIGFERRIHQRRRFKRGCKIESIFRMDQMPRSKFCARGPGIFPPLPDSMEFPDPFGWWVRRSVCSIALLLVCLDWKSDSGSMRVSKRAGVRRVRRSVYYTTSFLVCPRRRTKFPIILRLDYKVATLPSASLLPNTHKVGLIATSLVLPRVAGFQ